jgi:hypothetical protein
VRLRIRRRAKKELLDIDDDATFFAVVRAIPDLEPSPRPRGDDRVEGQAEPDRIWVGRDWRVLSSIPASADQVVIEAVRKTDEGTSRRGVVQEFQGIHGGVSWGASGDCGHGGNDRAPGGRRGGG